MKENIINLDMVENTDKSEEMIIENIINEIKGGLYIESKDSINKKSFTDIKMELEDKILKDLQNISPIILQICSRNKELNFYRGFKKVLNHIGDKIIFFINDEILKYKEKNNHYSFEEKTMFKEIYNSLLDDNTSQGFIGYIIIDLQTIYRSGKNKKINGILKPKSKEELKQEIQIKDNIRYLFSMEKLEMSYFNLFKIIQKYLKKRTI